MNYSKFQDSHLLFFVFFHFSKKGKHHQMYAIKKTHHICYMSDGAPMHDPSHGVVCCKNVLFPGTSEEENLPNLEVTV